MSEHHNVNLQLHIQFVCTCPTSISSCASLTCPYRIILVFIPLSYVPQYHRIFMHKSTYGLSPYFLLFSTLVSTSFLGSGVFQAAYTYSNRCCREDPGVERGIHCYGIQMGAWQALIQWVCCTGLYVSLPNLFSCFGALTMRCLQICAFLRLRQGRRKSVRRGSGC